MPAWGTRVEGRSGPRSWAAAAAWGLWGLAVLGWVGTGWLDGRLREAGMAEAAWFAGAPWAGVVAALERGHGGGGDRRLPSPPPGGMALLLGLGLGLTYQAFGSSHSRYGLVARPGVLPGASYLAGFFVGTLLYLACAAFVLLLTPTGSLPSPRWRWWARGLWPAPGRWACCGGGALSAAVGAGVPGLREPVRPGPAGAGGDRHPGQRADPRARAADGAGSLVGRFRRACGVERQQLRWLAFGAALLAVALLVALVALPTLTGDDVFQLALRVCFALLLLATGAAILRYRLYDIDRIVSRTVATGCSPWSCGGYAAVALVLGQLVGRDSSLAVAGATLAVAAVFQPARRRVQAAVDRRFNRGRHDAAWIIEGFGPASETRSTWTP